MPKNFDIPQTKLFYSAIGSIVFVLLFALLFPSFSLFDTSLVRFFAAARSPFWDAFFLSITSLGNPEILEVMTILLAVFFLLRKDMAHFFIFLGTVIGNIVSIEILKDLTLRARPNSIAPVYQETGFSFPSAHAAISVVFYGLLAYLAVQKTKTKSARMNILFAWSFFIVMIGFSRLYLGVHFPTDILAGYAVGFFWLSVGIIAFEQLFSGALEK